MTDFRSELQALVSAYDEHGGKWPQHHEDALFAAVDRARTALAEPEPEGPTDEELLELMPQQFRDDLATVSCLAAHGAGSDVGPGLFRVSLNTGALDFARAVFARWGRPTPRPESDGPAVHSREPASVTYEPSDNA